MVKSIDLSCDVGESFGIYKYGYDAQVMKYITSASIACGFHAGDPKTMHETLLLAKKNGVSIGAHPGLPDLLGFGRRMLKISPEEACDYMIYQIGALEGMAKRLGLTVDFVKLHGAFGRMTIDDQVLAKSLAKALYEFNKNIIVVAFWGSQLSKEAKKIGLKVAEEILLDRGYSDVGKLVPHGIPGAVIKEQKEVIDRLKKIVMESKINLLDGSDVKINIQSLCFHVDTTSLETVRDICSFLDKVKIKRIPLLKILN